MPRNNRNTWRTAKRSKTPKAHSFLDFAPELRNQIYDQIRKSTTTLEIEFGGQPLVLHHPLALTCKQLYREFSLILKSEARQYATRIICYSMSLDPGSKDMLSWFGKLGLRDGQRLILQVSFDKAFEKYVLLGPHFVYKALRAPFAGDTRGKARMRILIDIYDEDFDAVGLWRFMTDDLSTFYERRARQWRRRRLFMGADSSGDTRIWKDTCEDALVRDEAEVAEEKLLEKRRKRRMRLKKGKKRSKKGNW